MHKRSRHCGYVLPVLLVVLCVAAVALQAIVTRSMRASLRSLDERETLQRRWGMLSCQETALRQAPQILRRAELAGRGKPVSHYRTTLNLGGQEFELILSDEQSKANVNLLYDRLNATQFDAAVIRLQGTLNAHSDPHPLRARIPRPVNRSATQASTRPATAPAPPTVRLPAFESFGQIFPSAAPEQLIGSMQEAGLDLTLWGDGRLNVMRASPQALEIVCRPVLDRIEIQRLAAMRRATPDQNLSKLLSALALTQEKREHAQMLLTDHSDCHSLWIINHSGGRTWYRLAVLGGGEDDRVVHYW
jgi:hypothetical protein